MRSRDSFAQRVAKSPVMTCAAAVTLIAGACTSAANALVLTALAAVVMPLLSALAALEKDRLNVALRPLVFALVSVLAVFGVSLLIDNVIAYDSVIALGVYAPLLAFDALAVSSAEHRPDRIEPGKAALGALCDLVPMVCIALPASLVREVLGSGTLFGASLGFRGADAFALPFMGFILCAFGIALLRSLFAAEDK